jgi:acetate kinase
MGFTPLEGLVMGTRSGDVDAGLALELARKDGADAVLDMLNKRSGLQGLSGASDLRDVHARADAGDVWAGRALEVYAYRIRKVIGAYAAAMNGLDAVVFTAGAGENDRALRASVLNNLGFLGLELDAGANQTHGPVISKANSRVTALVVPTDEEWAIALETQRLLEGA